MHKLSRVRSWIPWVAVEKSPSKSRMYRRALKIALLFSLAIGTSWLHAQTVTWKAAATDVNWTTATNWTGSVTSNIVPTTNDDVVLITGTSFQPTTQNIAALSLHSLTFNAGTPAYTIGGTGAFTFNGTGVTDSSSTNHILNIPITLTGTETFTITSAAINFTVSSVIGSTGALTKTGAGTLTLTGANTYTGNTNINGGVLNAGVAEVAGTSGPMGKQTANAAGTIVFGGGTLQYSGANANDYSGRFSTAASQPIVIDTNSQTVTFATALISSSGTLTKLGAGTLTLSGVNTYNGATTVNGGTLTAGVVTQAFGVNSAVTLANTAGVTLNLNGFNNSIGSLTGGGGTGGNVTLGGAAFTIGGDGTSPAAYAGVISGTGSLTKTGAGTLTLSGSNTYNGTTLVSTGTLRGASRPVAGSVLWLDATDATTMTKDALNRVSQWRDKLGGANNLAQATVNQQPIQLANMINGMPAVRFSSAQTCVLNTATNFASPTTVLFVGRLTGGSNGRLVGGNPGNWLMGYHGGFMDRAYFSGWVNQPNTVPTAAIALYTGVIPGGATASSFYKNGTLLASNTGGVTGPQGFELGGYNGNNEISDGDIGEVLIYNRALSASEQQTVEAYLNAKWFGTTTNIIPDTSDVTVSAGATLDLSYANETIGSLAGAGNLVLGGTTTTNGDNASTTFSGPISGYGGLAKQGSGTLILSGANTYSGTTTVSTGTLQVGNGGTTGSLGTGDTVNNASLVFNVASPTNVVYNGGISGTGSLNMNGTGTVTLGGASTYSGATVINSGTIKLGNPGVPAGYQVHYSFDSGGAVNDGFGGNIYDGTLTASSGAAATIVAGGRSGSGQMLNITANQYVNVNRNFQTTGGFWTASVWFNGLYGSGNWRTLFRGQDLNSGGGDHPTIVQAGSWQLGWYNNNSSVNGFASGFNASVPAINMQLYQTGWHQLTTVARGNATDFYLDGAFAGTAPGASARNIWAVGNIQSGGQPFALNVDDCYIYPRVLSAGEVQQLYLNGVLPPATAVQIASGATLDLNGIKQSVASLADIGGSGGQIINSAATTPVAFTISGASGSTTFSGTISDSGAANAISLVKAGASTQILAGASTYSGSTTISAGVLTAAAAGGNTLPIASTVVLANTVGATFNLANNQTIGALAGGGALGGNVTLGSNTLTVGGAATSTYYGSIGGTGGLSRAGTGTLILAGNNGYSGATTINAGTIKLTLVSPGLFEGRVSGSWNTTSPNPNTSVQLGTRYANIADGSPGYANTGGAWTDNSTYIYSGNIINSTGSTVTWTFAKNFDDATTLRIDGNTILNDGSWNNPVYANYTLTPGAHAFDLRLGQGGGGVGPNGPAGAGGWWTNSPAMGFGYDPLGRNQAIFTNYQKMTDPGDGSLFTNNLLSSNTPLPTGTAVNMTGGTLDLNGVNQTVASIAGSGGSVVNGGGAPISLTLTAGSGVNTTYSGVISTAIKLIKSGLSTQVLSTNNTFSGSTLVNGGILRLSAAGSLSASNFVTVTGGGTFDVANTNAGVAHFAVPAGIPSTNLILNGGTFSMTAPVGVDCNDSIAGLTLASGSTSNVLSLTAAATGSPGNCKLTAGIFNTNNASLTFNRISGSVSTANLLTSPEALGTQYPSVTVNEPSSVTGFGFYQTSGVGVVATQTVPGIYYRYFTTTGANTSNVASMFNLPAFPVPINKQGVSNLPNSPAVVYPNNNTPPVGTGNTNSSFDLSPDTQISNFGFTWTGYINIPTTGNWTFYTNSDDGSMLYIGTTLVVSNDGGHGPTEKWNAAGTNGPGGLGAAIALNAGLNPITVLYVEGAPTYTFNAAWSGPGVAKAGIPNNVLFTEPSPAAVPVISPPTGPLGTTVTLSSTTPNATIYYTLDGSDPTYSSTRTHYTAPFIVSSAATLYAVAQGLNAAGTSTIGFGVSAPSMGYYAAPGVVVGTKSTISVSPVSIQANGAATSTITITLKDANGVPVNAKTVSLVALNGSSNISAPSGTSGSNGQPGQVTFTVTDSTAQIVSYQATDTTDTIVIGPATGGSGSVFAYVPEAAGYNLVYQLAIPNAGNWNSVSVPYAPDNHLSVTYPFDRIAYYLELNNGGGLQYAYTSFNAFTTDVTKIGVPNVASGEFYNYANTPIANMNVFSNMTGVVATGTGWPGGNIEFWPSNYNQNNDYGVPNASSSTFDFGDGGANTSAGYGAMRINNHFVTPTTGQTIIAYNWNGGGTGDLGIGNQPTGNPNWTFANNAGGYSVKNLQILVHPTGGATVQFYGAPTAAQSTVAASPTTVLDDGISTSTVTVTIKDVNGAVVPGKNVTLNSSSATTNTPLSGTTNASGQVVFAVTDTVSENAVFTAIDTADSVTVAQTATVTYFSPLPAEYPYPVIAGLNYQYYDATNFSGGTPLPFNGAYNGFNTYTPLSFGLDASTGNGTTQTLFSFSPPPQGKGTDGNDNFGYKYTGYISVAQDGLYTFYTTSDDGSELFIGTTMVVQNNYYQGMTERSGFIALKAGLHSITIMFRQGTGGYGLNTSYSGTKFDGVTSILSKTLIPDNVFSTSPPDLVAQRNPPVIQVGGVAAGSATAVAMDAAGNRYVTGYFSGIVDFNPNLTSDPKANGGGNDVFVTRFNANGSYAWTQTFGGSGDDRGFGVAVSGGVVYVTGEYSSPCAGFSSPAATLSRSRVSNLATINTYSPHRLTAGKQVVLTGVDIANGGNGYNGTFTVNSVLSATSFTYTTSGQADEGTTNDAGGLVGTVASTPGGTGGYDTFVLALDSTLGTPISGFGGATPGIQTFGGTGDDVGQGVAVSGSTVYVTGYFNSANAQIAGTGATLATSGGNDAFVLALNATTGAVVPGFNSNGFQKFGGSTPGTADDRGQSVAVDASGNVYVAGTFSSSNAGIGGTGSIAAVGNVDTFVMALSATGAALTPTFNGNGVQTFGGSGATDLATGVAVSATTPAIVYVSGSFNNTSTVKSGGSNISTSGGYDAFVLALDTSTGKPPASGFGTGGVQKIGGTLDDFGQSVAVLGSTVYVAGYFSSNNFGIGATGTVATQGGADVFVAALDAGTGLAVGGAGGFNTTGLQTFGGTSGDYGYGVAVNGSTSTLCVAGSFSSLNAGVGGNAGISAAQFGGFLLCMNSGTGASIPKVTSPLQIVAGVNQLINYQITGTSTPTIFGAPTPPLPTFLTVNNSTGVISGTPTVANLNPGTFTFTVSVANAYGIGLASVTLNVIPDAVATTYPPVIQVGGNTGSAQAVAIDSSGNRYVAGYFSGQCDFNPGFGADAKTCYGSANAFVTRFNANGSYAWTQTFGGANNDKAYGIAVSSDGSKLYVTGSFSSTNAGIGIPGNITTCAGNVFPHSDAFVMALNSSDGSAVSTFGTGGVVVFGGTGDDAGAAVTASASAVYVTGKFQLTNKGVGKAVGSAGGYDAFVLALDPASGAAISTFGPAPGGVQQFGGNLDDSGSGIVISGSTLYVSGSFSSTSGTGGITTTFGSDAFVLALNAGNGTPVGGFGTGGVQKFGGNGNDLGNGVAVLGTTVYVTGSFSSTNAGVGGSGSVSKVGASTSNAFVVALDSSTGAKVPGFGPFTGGGVQTFGGSSNNEVDEALAIVANISNSTLYITGDFASTTAKVGGAGPAFSSVLSSTDAFVLALDAGSGAAVGGFGTSGVQTFGGSGSDRALGMALYGTNVYITGDFQSTDAGVGGVGGITAIAPPTISPPTAGFYGFLLPMNTTTGGSLPRITSPLQVATGVGQPVSYTITATPLPIGSYSASNLPMGLSFNANLPNGPAVISGIVTAPAALETVWVEDSIPTGGVPASDGGDTWSWVSSNTYCPAPFSGTLAHQSDTTVPVGEHQHYFTGATQTLSIAVGDNVFAYVYIDPANVPNELMLQWNVAGSWEHRAIWGSDILANGNDNTVARYHAGALPPTGQWVRLEVPASAVGLEGQIVSGMAFTLNNGRATWDRAGKFSPAGNPIGTYYITLGATNSVGNGQAVLILTVLGDSVASTYPPVIQNGGPGLSGNTQAVAVDASGNRYVTGYFTGVLDFNPGVGSDVKASALGRGSSTRDVFVTRFNANGSYAWTQIFGGSDDDEGEGIAVSGSVVYVTGKFASTDAGIGAPGTVGSLSPIGGNAFVLALNAADGSPLSGFGIGGSGVQTFGGNSSNGDIGNGVAVSGSTVYVAGSICSPNAGLGGTLGTYSLIGTQQSAFALALSASNGAAITGFGNNGMVTFGGTGIDQAQALVVSGGNLYLTGSFTSSDAGVGAVGTISTAGGSGYPDAFVLSVNSGSGAANEGFGMGGVQTFGGTYNDYSQAIAISGSKLYVAGYFESMDATVGAPNTTVSRSTSNTGVLATLTTLNFHNLLPGAIVNISGVDFNGGGYNGTVTVVSNPATDSRTTFSYAITSGGAFEPTTADTGGTITLATIGSTVYGNDNAFVLALDAASGSALPAFGGLGNGVQKFGGSTGDVANAVAASATTVYIGGYLTSTNAGIGGTGSISAISGSKDAYIAALNGSTGAALSGFGTGGVLQFGGSLGDVGNGLALSATTLFMTGTFASTDAGVGGTGLFDSTGFGGFLLAADPATGSSVPRITSPLAAGGGSGFPFSYTITASGNPTSFAATPMPNGLTINAAGVIFGNPTTGTYTITLSAINASGAGTAKLVLTVLPDAVAKTNPPVAQGSIQGVAIDGAGNRYVVGSFSGAVDFNPQVGADVKTSAGSVDAFVTRFNANGSYSWTQTFGGGPNAADQANGVAVTGSGVYVVGEFSGTAGFGGTVEIASPVGGTNVFVLALDPATGNPLPRFGTGGVQIFGGSNTDVGYSIAASPNGNVYVAGTLSSLNAGVGGLGTIGSTDDKNFFSNYAFVLALNSTTGLAATFGTGGVQLFGGGGGADDVAFGIALSASTVYACGQFTDGYTTSNEASIGGGAQIFSATDGDSAFVMALNINTGLAVTIANGAVKDFGTGGVQVFGGTTIGARDFAQALAVSGSTVYVTGYLGTANARIGGAGPPIGALGGSSAFVLALDAVSGLGKIGFGGSNNGMQVVGGTSLDQGNAIAVTNSAVFIGGQMLSNNMGIGALGSFGTSGSYDAFVAALNPASGAAIGTFGIGGLSRFGGSQEDTGYGLAAYGQQVYLAGSFNSTNAGINGLGSMDSTGFGGFIQIFGTGAAPGTATTLAVSVTPLFDTVGVPATVTVTALDSSGNVATGYTGTVHYTSTNSGTDVLPGNYTFGASDNGSKTFPITFNTPGSGQSVIATDTVTGTITGTQLNITVYALATQLVLSGFPSTIGSDVPGQITVTAEDGSGHIASNYTGTINFTSNDGAAILPGNYTFALTDNGTKTFTVTLKTATTTGSITATDIANGSITGTQGPLTSPTPSPITVTAPLPPLVNAGSDDAAEQNGAGGAGYEPATLFGTATAQFPATSIATTVWSCTGYPAGTGDQTTINNLIASGTGNGSGNTLNVIFDVSGLTDGLYTMTLTATDNLGGSAFSAAHVTVDAYSTTHITSVTLTNNPNPASGYLIYPPIQTVTLTASLPASDPGNTAILAEVEYRYWVSINGTWSILQDWSASTTATAYLNLGQYSFQVDARQGSTTMPSTGSGKEPLISAMASNLNVVPGYVTSIIELPRSAQGGSGPFIIQENYNITTNTSPNTGSGQVYAQIYIWSNATSSYSIVDPWGPVGANTGPLPTDELQSSQVTRNAGIYHFLIFASTVKGVMQAYWQGADFTVGLNPVTAVTFDSTYPQTSPGQIVAHYTATGGGATVYYQVWLYSVETNTYTIEQDWNSANNPQPHTSASITINGLNTGHYKIWMYASAVSGVNQASLLSGVLNVTGAGVTGLTFDATFPYGSPTSGLPAGQAQIQYTATGSGLGAQVYYQLWLYGNANNSYTLLRDWTLDTTTHAAYNATNLSTGSYQIWMYASTVAGNNQKAALSNIFTVAGNGVNTVVSDSIDTSVPLQATIHYHVTKTGTDQVYYRINVQNGSTWTTPQNWTAQGDSASYTATGLTGGSYRFYIEATTIPPAPTTTAQATVYPGYFIVTGAVGGVVIDSNVISQDTSGTSTITFHPTGSTLNSSSTIFYEVVLLYRGVNWVVVQPFKQFANPGNAEQTYSISGLAAGTYDWYVVGTTISGVDQGTAGVELYFFVNAFGVPSPSSDNPWTVAGTAPALDPSHVSVFLSGVGSGSATINYSVTTYGATQTYYEIWYKQGSSSTAPGPGNQAAAGWTNAGGLQPYPSGSTQAGWTPQGNGAINDNAALTITGLTHGQPYQIFVETSKTPGATGAGVESTSPILSFTP